jgi:uncharacterized membrane protein YhhN
MAKLPIIKKIIEASFGLSAVLFIVLLPYTPSTLTTLIKIAPICMLAILVLLAKGNWKKLVILAALTFSAGGDIFMELDNFIFGLSAFFIAHICYLVVFFHHIEFKKNRILLSLLIVTSTVISAIILSPNLGELANAVYFYITIIAIMGIAASLGAKNHPLVILGALIFMVSDSIIAFNRFNAPIEDARYAIMITYYLAQYLLTIDARSNQYT